MVEDLASAVWVFGTACVGAKTRVRDMLELTRDGRITQPEGTVWVLPNPHADPL